MTNSSLAFQGLHQSGIFIQNYEDKFWNIILETPSMLITSSSSADVSILLTEVSCLVNDFLGLLATEVDLDNFLSLTTFNKDYYKIYIQGVPKKWCYVSKIELQHRTNFFFGTPTSCTDSKMHVQLIFKNLSWLNLL